MSENGPFKYSDPYRGKWNHYSTFNQVYWSPVQGKGDATKNIALDTFTWHFIPLIFPQAKGVITELSLYGQNNSGGGGAVNIGWGLYEAADASSANPGRLGTQLLTGVAATTDNTNGEIVLASSQDIAVNHSMLWLGVGGDAAYNIQVRDSAGPVPGLPGLGGTFNLSVCAFKMVPVFGTAAPAAWSAVITGLDLPALYCKWKPQ